MSRLRPAAALALMLAVSAAAQTEVKLALTGAAGQASPGLALPPFEAEDPKIGDDDLPPAVFGLPVLKSIIDRLQVRCQSPAKSPDARTPRPSSRTASWLDRVRAPSAQAHRLLAARSGVWWVGVRVRVWTQCVWIQRSRDEYPIRTRPVHRR